MKTIGLNQVLQQLAGLDVTDQVNNIIDKGGEDILQTAKSNVDSSEIRGSLVKVSRNENGGYVVTVGSDLLIAPYHEFGTGTNVFKIVNGAGSAFTGDDRTYAQEFYVNGEGYRFARPYLLPAYYRHRREIAQEIERLINGVV
jgi:hypothetical protein